MPSAYDDVADWYDTVIRSGTIVTDAAAEQLLDLVGDVTGVSIADVGCGQGVIARALSGRGAHVRAVDASTRLLQIARAEPAPPPGSIAYGEDDAEKLERMADASVAGVVCNLALMDIGDLAAAATAIHRVLQAGGWCVATIMHPCFMPPQASWITKEQATGRWIRGYFQEGPWRSNNPSSLRQRVGAVHRTLSTYLNTFADAGFDLVSLREPPIEREPGAMEPAYDEVPALLAARWRRQL